MCDGLDVNIQFTASYIQQQNGTMKRSFVMSYGCIQVMLNATGIHGELRSFLWLEAANYKNDTDNVSIEKRNGSGPLLGNSRDFRITCTNLEKSG